MYVSNMVVSNPILSVLVPVFNTEPYLRQCLDSLISQNLEGLEVVCIDNGSTDGSLAVLREYEKQFAQVQVAVHPEGRQGDARNAGIKIARGEYIGFVDSDDFCDPDMFRHLSERAITSGADIAVCNINCFYQNSGKMVAMLNGSQLDEDEGFEICEKPFLLRNLTICNKIIRSEFIKENSLRFPEGVWHEDAFFVSLALFLAKKVVCVPDPLYIYRKDRDGSVGSHAGERNLDIFKMMMNLEAELEKQPARKVVSQLLSEAKALRYLYLYRNCRGKTKGRFFEKMKTELQGIYFFKTQILSRSEARECNLISGRLGYRGFEGFLRLKSVYGAVRRLCTRE